MNIGGLFQRHRYTARRLVVFGLMLAAVACSDGDRGPSSRLAGNTLERARLAKTIRVGFANEAPYAYLDIVSGKLTGEAPEIAKVVLAELGIPEVEGVLAEFGALIPGLKAGRFDVIAAGMYILPERCREIAFSNPTYSVGENFVVKKGNPKSLHSYADLTRQTSTKVGVVAGAVQQQYARQAQVPDAQVVIFPDAPSALEGVMAGRADAYAGTSLTINYLLRLSKSDRLERADPFNNPVIAGKPVRGYGAFGFRKQDTDLLNAFNRGLADFIGSPRHLELVRRFGFTSQELPGQASADALCRD